MRLGKLKNPSTATRKWAILAEQAREFMGLFERWLSLWVALAIGGGTILGNIAPVLTTYIAALDFASVYLVVAILICAMIYPKVGALDFGSLREIGIIPKCLVIPIVVNWLIKPYTMAALAVVFFDYLY